MLEFLRQGFFPNYPKGCYCSDPHYHDFAMERTEPCGGKVRIELTRCCRCQGTREYTDSSKTWTVIVRRNLSGWRECVSN